MNILLSPQIRDNDKIWYEIEEQKITVTINDISDTFDFTDMPDGELQMWDDEGNELIETGLDKIPILGAEKKDGVLNVEILFSIDINEQDERLLFPKPMTLDEFNNLMAELVERGSMFKDDVEEPEDVSGETEDINIEEVDF